ncbi:hypothetical protein BH09GEM1_BH09GEM1_44330 [soil metagenome]
MTRTLTAVTSAEKVTSVYDGAAAGAFAHLVSSVFVDGAASPGAIIVFRFLTSASSGVSNSAANSGTDLMLSLNGATGFAYDRTVKSGGGVYSTASGATATGTGVDLYLSLAGFSGNYFYEAVAHTESFLNRSETVGERASSSLTATLSGIDAVDAGGNIIASAAFAADGSATLNVTGTPEPASLVLTATGFLLALTIRRRRRA